MSKTKDSKKGPAAKKHPRHLKKSTKKSSSQSGNKDRAPVATERGVNQDEQIKRVNQPEENAQSENPNNSGVQASAVAEAQAEIEYDEQFALEYADEDPAGIRIASRSVVNSR